MKRTLTNARSIEGFVKTEQLAATRKALSNASAVRITQEGNFFSGVPNMHSFLLLCTVF